MTMKTMFPSHVNEDGITKGCMLLLKIKPVEKLKTTQECALTLKYSYENALSGNEKDKKKEVKDIIVKIPPTALQVQAQDKGEEEDKEKEWFESSGVCKVIALTHYINLCRAVIANEEINERVGIPYRHNPKAYATQASKNSWTGEQLSSQVEILESFKDYFSNRCELLKDQSMKDEISLIDKLIQHHQKKQVNTRES